MFYFQSCHGLACRWPPPQACYGSRFGVERRLPPSGPAEDRLRFALSVAPFSAALVARALRAGLGRDIGPVHADPAVGLGPVVPPLRFLLEASALASASERQSAAESAAVDALLFWAAG
jgi:hypothetical protein